MKKIILSLVAGALLVPALTFAAYWQADENVSVNASQPVQDNAYLAGNTLAVSGDIGGDLFGAGSTVSISGNVSGDIMAAGSVVNIFDAQAEDVRVAGSDVNIGGIFTGELLAAGSNVIVAADTQIARNSHLIGSALNFNGIGAGHVFLSGEQVKVDGTVEGNLTVKTAGTLVIGPNAVIEGDLNYSSPTEAALDPGAEISGKVNYSQMAEGEAQEGRGFRAAFLGIFTALFLVKLLTMLLGAYILWYAFRKDSVAAVQQGLSNFGTFLLRGFIFLVVVPAAIVVLCFTIIGIPIAIFSLLVYIAILMLASPLAILFASSLIMKRKIDLQWYHILLGAVVLGVLKIVPVIGWLAIFIVYLATLGSLITVLRAKFKR